MNRFFDERITFSKTEMGVRNIFIIANLGPCHANRASHINGCSASTSSKTEVSKMTCPWLLGWIIAQNVCYSALFARVSSV